MKFSKQVLYDADWQKLRVSLLAVNNKTGGWEYLEGAKTNIQRLRDYIAESLTDVETAIRRWRVLNLLNATLLGYGSRKKGTAEEAEVIKYRDEVSREYATTKHLIDRAASSGWDWDAQRVKLAAMLKEDPAAFKRIEDNLALRVKTANRKEVKQIGGMQFRTELQHWLSLMADVKNSK